MKLLEEMIELASAEKGSVATLLRKCLILAHDLKNDRLKTWAESELNGYSAIDVGVPEYRQIQAAAKGLFVASSGSKINNQPIPPGMLRQEHRRFAESVALTQPVASYENLVDSQHLRIEWPPDLTGLYEAAFFGGNFALIRAWQEFPRSVLIGLIDTIKTRVLRFALELRADLGLVSDNLGEVPKEKIEQLVVNNIYGGNVVISSRDFTQTSTTIINMGDWTALASALEKSGVEGTAIAELKSALDEDSRKETSSGIGKRTLGWLKQLGKTTGHVAVGVGTEVAKKWILEYLGLKS